MKTIGEFKSLFDLLQAFPTEESCIEYLEKKLWNGTPVSPYDPTSKVYRRGDGMYRCKNTGKNFNIRIGTLFEGSKISLRKWFYAVYMVTCHTKGISSVQLSKDIHVTQKTAWFMTHHIREAFKQDYKEKFDGEVELDETFVGGKNKNRHWNKKAKNKHHVVDHGHGIYVSGGAYTNTIEAFWGNYCKRAINGIYNWVSRKHMQQYFDEFCFRYKTRNVSINERFAEAILHCKSRLTNKKQQV